VLEADFLEERQMSSEQREIRNYVEATEAACAEIDERGITRSFLGQLQQMIVRGTPGDTSDAGDIRPYQVAIGPKDRPIEEARFVPCPPGDQLEAGVRAWEQWVAADSDLLVVAKVAIAHYQFETLHPYSDGNGRLGRLVSILQLIKAGELRWPVLNIAPWFESHRDLYQQGLMNVTLTGDFNPWVELFAYAVELQARQGLKKIQELLALRDEMVGELRARGFRGSAIEIAEILIGYPVIDVRTASNLIHKTFEATNVAIGKLVEHGFLEEITGRSQNRLFGCYRVAATIVG
jgi:Fic family protein